MSNPEKRNKHNPAVIMGCLAVIFVYTIVRALIYRSIPVHTLDDWFVRDNVMTIPRVAGFGSLLLLNRWWKICRFDMPLADFGRAMRWGAIPIALWLFYCSGAHGGKFTPVMTGVGFCTSLVVGLYEEYAFRGPLLSALRERISVFSTILLTSAIFTIYHIQAQPLDSWGTIFLMGIILANLRLRGLGLGWLALIHGLIDTTYFLFAASSPGSSSAYGLVLHAGLLIYAILTFPR